MKKMTIAVLLLAMTVWFAACTNDANAPATQAQESTETQNAVSDDTAAEPEMTETPVRKTPKQPKPQRLQKPRKQRKTQREKHRLMPDA